MNFCKSFCLTHYNRYRRHGDPSIVLRRHQLHHGDTHLNSDGYVLQRIDGRDRLMHRHVMEQYIGRPLLKSESVHHRNGVRSDNRIENLELWTTHQPMGQRAEELLSWAKEIIQQYEGTKFPSSQ